MKMNESVIKHEKTVQKSEIILKYFKDYLFRGVWILKYPHKANPIVDFIEFIKFKFDRQIKTLGKNGKKENSHQIQQQACRKNRKKEINREWNYKFYEVGVLHDSRNTNVDVYGCKNEVQSLQAQNLESISQREQPVIGQLFWDNSKQKLDEYIASNVATCDRVGMEKSEKESEAAERSPFPESEIVSQNTYNLANPNRSILLWNIIDALNHSQHLNWIEKALPESDRQFSTRVENFPRAIYRSLCSDRSKMASLARVVQRKGNTTADPITDRKCILTTRIIHHQNREQMNGFIAQGVNAKQPYTLEYRIILANGKLAWIAQKSQDVCVPDESPPWIDRIVCDPVSPFDFHRIHALDLPSLKAVWGGVDGVFMANRKLPAGSRLQRERWNSDELNECKQIEWESTAISPIICDRGKIAYFVKVAEDGTDRKQVEEALKRANEELENRVDRRTAELKAANDRLQREIAHRARTEAELEASLSLLRGTLEATNDGIIVTQNGSKIATYNQKFVQMWSISEAAIADRDLARLLPTILEQLKDPESFLDRTQELFSQPDAEGYGIFELKDGRIFERYSMPQRQGKKVVGRVCRFRDITHRERREAALRESEERYRAAIEQTSDGIFLVDVPTLRILEANAAYCNLLGYTEEELVELTVYDVVFIERETIDRYVRQILAKKYWSHREVCHRRKDGSLVNVEVSLNLISYGGRQVVCAVVRDITDRKKAEEEKSELIQSLQESEARYRALLDAIPDLMIRMSRDGTYLDFIPPTNFKTTMSSREMRGKNIDEVMPSAIAREQMDYVEKALATRQSQSYEFEMEREDGTVSYQEARIAVSGEDEVLVMVRDITDRKQIEEALRESEAQYRRIIETTSEGVWIIDAENNTLFANHTMAQMLGYSLDEIIGMPLLALMDEEWQAIAAENCDRHGIQQHFEFKFRRKDGSELWAIVSTTPILDRERQHTSTLAMVTDITHHVEAEKALEQAERKYRSIFENVVEGIFQTTVEGSYVTANPMLARIFGYDSPEELIADLRDIQHQVYVDPDRRREFMHQVRDRGAIWGFESQVYRKDGTIVWISENAYGIYDESGRLIGYEGTMQDVSDRKRVEEELRQSRQMLQLVIDNIPQFIFWKDRNSIYLGCNRNFAKAAGLDRVEDIVGKTDYDLAWKQEESDFFRECDRRVMESNTPQYHIIEPQLHADCKQCWVETNKIPLHDADGNVVGILGTYEDITERQQAQETIEYQATHDLLTGLPNRMLFDRRLLQELQTVRKRDTAIAVMFLDLDRFKTINDTLGHAVGDRLLKEVAERVRGCLREYDTFARWGGDEFTILLPQIEDIEESAAIAQRILDTLKPAFALEGHLLHISSSIGIALSPCDGEDEETLLRNADAALYRAKEYGRNNYQFYTPAMNSQASELLVLENQLHNALTRSEFVVYYQPQVNTTTGEINGMEALVRWQHPQLGLVAPDKFIPLAEETGLIVPIGEWVLWTACAQNKAWQDAGLPPLRIAVNLSARQFQQPNLVEMVAKVLSQTQLAPQYLELEITESVAMQDREKTQEILKEFHQMGVHLSIDDFGTGYSSLAYLKQFPFNNLKIDKSFVRDLTTNPKDAGIVNAIVNLGMKFNFRIVAEGVETEAQKDLLQNLNCENMQGYLFSKPLSAQAATNLMCDSRCVKIVKPSCCVVLSTCSSGCTV